MLRVKVVTSVRERAHEGKASPIFVGIGDMSAASGVRKADDATFDAEVLSAATPVLVCFYTEQGGVGDVIKRIAETVARSHEKKVRVVMVDIDRAPKVARKYAVLTTPTFLLFRDGRKRVTAVGYQRESDIQKLLDRFSERDPEEPKAT